MFARRYGLLAGLYLILIHDIHVSHSENLTVPENFSRWYCRRPWLFDRPNDDLPRYFGPRSGLHLSVSNYGSRCHEAILLVAFLLAIFRSLFQALVNMAWIISSHSLISSTRDGALPQIR